MAGSSTAAPKTAAKPVDKKSSDKPFLARTLPVILCLLASLAGPIIYSRYPDFLSSDSSNRPWYDLNVPSAWRQDQGCDNPHYSAHILSYDPLIIHIENFLTLNERQYLLDIGLPQLEPSMVINADGSMGLDDFRTSSTAFLNRSDPAVQCITQRAAKIQGFIDPETIEGLQMTSYKTGQEYKPHFDWFGEIHKQPGQRISTFFVTVVAECQHCGTQFPELAFDWPRMDPRWCRFVECNDTDSLTFQSVPGSAVFWRNLDHEGVGDERVLHAGLPLNDGHKVGINIWTKVPYSTYDLGEQHQEYYEDPGYDSGYDNTYDAAYDSNYEGPQDGPAITAAPT